MKKIIAMLLILITLFSNGATAKEIPPINERVKRSFFIDFPQARNIHFQSFRNTILVNYTDHCRLCLAVYREDGAFVGNGNYLEQEEIPLRLIRSLDKNFQQFEIEEAVEFFTEDNLSYYCLHLVTDKENIYVRTYDMNFIEIVKRESK
jgi:hypothetical protein